MNHLSLQRIYGLKGCSFWNSSSACYFNLMSWGYLDVNLKGETLVWVLSS